MIKQIFVLTLFSLGLFQSPQCTCTQLLSQQDCLNRQCSWNTELQSCQDGSTIVQSAFICYGLQNQECLKFDECSWVNENCTFFTGCTPFLYETEEKCNSLSKKCTSDGTKFVEYADCSKYLTQISCKMNKEKKYCVWDEQNKNCSETIDCDQLPESLKSDSECRKQLSQCTTSDSGCVLSKKTCNEQISESQCKWNLEMTIQCYYYQGQCLDMTCANAPGSLKTHQECQEYSNSCTIIESPNPSNSLGGCQNLTACSEYIKEDQCKIDSQRKSCIWKDQGCLEVTCDDAPQNLGTEKECQEFLFECTTKQGGGCVKKSTCQEVNVESACTTDIDGKVCYWVNEKCKEKSCSDYQASSNLTCLSVNCLYNSNGFCTEQIKCSSIKDSNSCSKGTDGYCMWISNYQNEDGSFGSCLLYSSCTSLPWKTHDECYGFSDKCTTNGETCVPITSCNETNVNGCYIGNDGYCKLDDNNKCVKETTCNQIQADSHEECQNQSSKCTSDGQNCIDLAKCSTYSKINCFINHIGVVKIDSQIISTGKCIWDTNTNQCKDLDCQDIQGEGACESELSTCVFYQNQCSNKKKCSDYNLECPENGTDGKCFSDSTCRLKQCSDISNIEFTIQKCSQELSDCISDGNSCIDKSACNTYKTQMACDSGGIDGICYFDNNTQSCKKMTQCISASQNQLACSSAGDRCIMESNQCISLTCQNQYEISQICTHYFDFSYSKITYCTLNENQCTEVNQTILDSTNCFSETLQRNTWNEINQKCQSCSYQDLIQIQNTRSTDCSYSRSCLNQSIEVEETLNMFTARIFAVFVLMSLQ